MGFRTGDRVRITRPNSEYTGCRGTIADPEGTQNREQGEVIVLGHQVAIDGENGLTRPFLLADLEALRAARVGERASESQGTKRESPPGGSV